MNLKPSALQLLSIDKGCVEVTFRIPSGVAEFILKKLTHIQVEKFQALCVYNAVIVTMTSMENTILVILIPKRNHNNSICQVIQHGVKIIDLHYKMDPHQCTCIRHG